MGVDDDAKDIYARRIGQLSNPGAFAHAVLFHVVKHLIQLASQVAVPFVQLDATNPLNPDSWRFVPLTEDEWDESSDNAGTALVVFNAQHWSPALPNTLRLQPLPSNPFTLPLWSRLLDEAMSGPLPQFWTTYSTYETGEIQCVAMNFVTSAEMRVAADEEQEVPRNVLQALLCYGWQLTRTYDDDPTSIHNPTQQHQSEVFILPPLDITGDPNSRRILQMLTNFLRRAQGGIATMELIVLLPLMHRTTFFTVVLTAKSVTVRMMDDDTRARCPGAGEWVEEVRRIWKENILLWLWNRKYGEKLSQRQRELLASARRAEVDLKWSGWKGYSSPDFESRHTTIKALALYYVLVFGLRQNGLINDPPPGLVCMLHFLSSCVVVLSSCFAAASFASAFHVALTGAGAMDGAWRAPEAVDGHVRGSACAHRTLAYLSEGVDAACLPWLPDMPHRAHRGCPCNCYMLACLYILLQCPRGECMRLRVSAQHVKCHNVTHLHTACAGC